MVPGLGLDFLNRIVNVQWAGGAIFIYGEWLGNKLHYVKVAGKDSNPALRVITLPESDARDLEAEATRFNTTGGSYGKKKKKDKDGSSLKDSKPVFLICGTRSVPHVILDELGNPFPWTDTYALIYKSNDGINWSVSREESAAISEVSILPDVSTTALVWDDSDPDKQSFYYDQFRSRFSPGPGTVEAFDQIFSSSDGAVWAQERNESVAGGDPATYKSAFLAHTRHNDCIDAFGNHVPDGFSTTDKKNKVTARPVKPPSIFYTGGGIGYLDGTEQAEVVTEDSRGIKTTKTTSIPGVANITCVAECNGILMAGGFVVADDITSAGAVAISTDNGDTWKPFAKTRNGVVFIIVAPMTDLSPEAA